MSKWGKIAARLTLLRLAVGKIDDRPRRATSEGPEGGGHSLAQGAGSPPPVDGVPSRGGPGGTETPADLDAPDWKQTGKRTLKEIKDDRVSLISAGMAYYFFLSIFPAFVAAIGILNLLDVDSQSLIRSVQNTLPSGAGRVIVSALKENQDASETTSLFIALAGIAAALWSASSGFVALQSGLNVAYDVPQDRKFIGKRLVALALIVVTGVFGGVPSPIFTFGEDTIFKVIGWVLTIVAVSILFSIYYYLAPNRKSPKWHWVSVGGVVGTLVWLSASFGFGVYVENYGNYEEAYGPVAGVIVLILWLYLTSISVLVGGELNAEIERQAEIKDGETRT